MWLQIKKIAEQVGDDVAIIGDHRSYTYSGLVSAVQQVSHQLGNLKHEVLALYIDNCPEWIVIDLACQVTGIKLLPLPSFFSDLQLAHAMKEAGASVVIHTPGDRLSNLFDLKHCFEIHGEFIVSSKIAVAPAQLPDRTAKITFTSGSTGEPRGVCLSNSQQLAVATALQNVVDLNLKKHLSILPFSTLLENVTGVYLTLLSAGSVLALSQKKMGFNGSSELKVDTLFDTINTYQPSSIIVLPELLFGLIEAIERGCQIPSSLKFIAVGGSKVSSTLLSRAKQLGLPVYEGYGLSECSSVVSVNTPGNLKIGSVGKPLKHVSVHTNKGEIFVSGNTFLGYVNQPETWGQDLLATGDLGYLDIDGYLFINGRKKNLLISSFGRNINPEWVESHALSNRLLKQCIVFGDAKPFCTALIYPENSSINVVEVQRCIDSTNALLPDYAQIKKWHMLNTPLTVEAGLLTANGRPKRHAIHQAYHSLLDTLYAIDL